MNDLRHQKYKNKQFNNTRVLKVKNSPLDLEKDFKQLSVNYIYKHKKKKKKKLTKKKTFEKIAWYDWYDSLINYVL